MDMPSYFRVGLVGAGAISEFHLRALRRLPNVSIEGIADLDRDRARQVADRFEVPFACGSLEELTRRSLDVVHVLTPPASHGPLALEALESGCHVLVEKPVATSVEECDELERTAHARNRVATVNHSLLYDAFVSRALDLVRRGAIGEVLTADYLRSSDYPPYRGGTLPPQYRDGGYPFRDLGVHALYLMEAFLGPLEDVKPTFDSHGGDPNLRWDEWRALVKCERGTGNVQLSWNIRPLHHLLIVQGTRGVLKVDLLSMTIALRRPTPLPKALERALNGVMDGLQTCTQVPANVVRFSAGRILPYHGLQMLVADFYARLASGEAPPVSLRDARRVVDWTERVAREGDEAKTRRFPLRPARRGAEILVTGATGFLGGHLVERLLEEGRSVRVLVRREPTAAWRDDPRVEIAYGDLGDPAAVDRATEGMRLVYHVGAAMSGSAADFERGSIAGTRNVVEATRREGARLVYVSSLSVLHAAREGSQNPVTEDWPLEPAPDQRGLYSWAKREAERIVSRAVRDDGLLATILRPGRIFGPGAPVLPPDMKLVKGRLIILGDGRLPLPLVYVGDVVDAMLAAADREEVFDGSVLHLVDDEVLTQDDLAKAWVAALSPATRVAHVPLPLLQGMALGFEVLGRVIDRAPPLSRYRLASALAPLRFDCRRAAERIGWKPRIGVRAGLQHTLALAGGATSSPRPSERFDAAEAA